MGPVSQKLQSENGLNTWDDLNMAMWLRANPLKEIPFITFANGKNDNSIGWPQAVEFLKALRSTKRAFTFRWGQGGHGERAIDMSAKGVGDIARGDRIDFQRNKALPAFDKFSLDDDPGNGEPTAGVPSGAINAYQRWNPATIVDRPDRFEIQLWLVPGTPATTATTDVTLRNTQTFRARAGQRFKWAVGEGRSIVQQGVDIADALGLVTVPGVALTVEKPRLLVVDLLNTP
jgi:hypothetical protein